ncbi:MAG: archaeal proteasome endopeptidase complex subunit alpha [DPANN group archaeon]|nr:archaeal proteasome endopeptidase complex subunit alpha [DPANN group archaeon]
MDALPDQMGYDRTIVVFSPDGRLFQVEYAREAVKSGSTAVGVVYKDGVILAAQKKVSKLLKFSEKIFQVDDHIGLVATGIVADARVLVDSARVKSQQNSLIYDEPSSLYSIAKYLADKQQLYTQHAGVRPYGVSMLIGGVTSEPSLYETDPSGLLVECFAKAVGRGASKVNKHFESAYKSDMNKDAALKFVIEGMKKESKFTAENLSITIIDKFGFTRLDLSEIKKLGV